MNHQKGVEVTALWALAGALVLAVCLAPCSSAKETKAPPSDTAQAQRSTTNVGASQSNSAANSLEIPPGTILPISLTGSFSTVKSKPGQTISGRIMQDVPLAAGQKIPRGSKVLGKVVSVIPNASGAGAEFSFRFDTLEMRGQKTSLTTNLRAIAGFMEVDQAQIPVHASGEGEVYSWLPTVQIGGDDVYGKEGTVTAWNNPWDVVGRSTEHGVLGRVSAREGSSCRGELYDNAAPQALWVFSSDACGVYGMAKLSIAHAGRENPVGLIVLKTTTQKLNLPGGTGMLLRVDQPAKMTAGLF
jgi:hypothetical protein